jgi:NADH-quinone oxidoreductase subunit N
VYSLALFLAFFVLDKVLIHDDFYWSIGDFKGLAKRNPWLALSMTVALLSMAGIPPLGGFFAKLFMLKAAFEHHHGILVFAGLTGSLIAMYYYLKFIISMYSRNPDSDVVPYLPLNYWDKMVMGFIGSTLLVLGLFPDLISVLIRF